VSTGGIPIPMAFGFSGDVAASVRALHATLAEPARLCAIR